MRWLRSSFENLELLQFRGPKRTPTAPLCFRVSRVRHAEPRLDSRTHCHSKIARKTCVLQFVFSAPPLPTLQRRWQPPKSVGARSSISYATGGSSGLLVHDLTPCSRTRTDRLVLDRAAPLRPTARRALRRTSTSYRTCLCPDQLDQALRRTSTSYRTCLVQTS